MPYLNDTKLSVSFENIKINTDNQLIEGVVKTTYDPSWGSVVEVDISKEIEAIKEIFNETFDKITKAIQDGANANAYINIWKEALNDPQNNYTEEQKTAIKEHISDKKAIKKLIKAARQKIEKEGISNEDIKEHLASNFVGRKVEKDDKIENTPLERFNFSTQEFLRICRLKIINNYSFVLPQKPPFKAENIKIGNNNYSQIKIENVDKKTSDIEKKENYIVFENFKISLIDENEAEKMYNFLSGIEKNIYGNTNKVIILNGKEITLANIISQNEQILLKLLNENKYNQLKYEHKLALNIPLVEWKLGYYYGAGFFYHWFSGFEKSGKNENIHLSDENFKELFENSSFFKEKLKEAKNSLLNNEIYNVNKTKRCWNNIKEAIINGDEVEIELPKNYQEADTESKSYMSYFMGYSVNFKETANLLDNSIIDDDLAYAIGSFTFNMNIKGRLKIFGKASNASIESSGIYYRIWDSFDFVGNQRLGNWSGDIFNPSTPNLYYSKVTIYNTHLRELYQIISEKSTNQEKTDYDFNVITKYNRIADDVFGIDYTIDFFDVMKAKIIKR